MSKPMGMMSGVYFVGRGELIQWINELLALNYTKVEDTSNGAAFCQVIDAIHPGTVALGRVKYDAYQAPDIVNNYKILQESFDKNGIRQHIDVDTLVKGKYMAALELFQWIHGYYKQQEAQIDEYDPVERRRRFKCKEPKGSVSKAKPAGMAKRKTKNAIDPTLPPTNVTGTRPGVIPGRKAPAVEKPVNAKRAQKQRDDDYDQPVIRKAPASATPANSQTEKELKQAKRKIEELNEEVERANQERDFYYWKLRKVEDFCQEHQDNDMVMQILNIVYEEDEENGFVAPEEDYDE